MTAPFSEKLRLVLKVLSLSGANVAGELGVERSVVSRWLSGGVQPSAGNLLRLSVLVGQRLADFSVLDWDREPEELMGLFGARPAAIQGAIRPRSPNGLPLAIWDQMVATSIGKGQGYEGFFRFTQPHPRVFGRYLHEYGMIRRDEAGLLNLRMGNAEVLLDGWMIPLHGQLYSICADVNTGTLHFGIYNGLGASRVDVFDGLSLAPAFDMGRSPSATALICERIGELSGNRLADDGRFEQLLGHSPLAPEGSIPEHIQRHLVRDIGPSQFALGGDWLLNMSLSRSMTRGRDYDAAAS